MAAARKTPRSTTPAKIGAKHAGAKRKRIAVLLSRVKPPPSTDLPAAPPGFLIVGIGTSGTLGLRAIKDESGLTIAQEPSSAKYQGMPRSAIAAGVVDVVKPPDQMSEPLLAYTRSLTRPALPLPEHEGSQTLRKIF